MIDPAIHDDIIKAARIATANHIVRSVMEEFAKNFNFQLVGLPEYGMNKVVMLAAIIAICYERGIDPEDLR